MKTLIVRAPIDFDEGYGEAETMHARPLGPHRAVLLNVPFFVSGMNYGDTVALGTPDSCGVRPVVEVLAAGGDRRVLVTTSRRRARELAHSLHRTFGRDELRIEGDGTGILTVGIPSGIDANRVLESIARWFQSRGIRPLEDTWSEVMPTDLGVVRWPRSKAA